VSINIYTIYNRVVLEKLLFVKI